MRFLVLIAAACVAMPFVACGSGGSAGATQTTTGGTQSVSHSSKAAWERPQPKVRAPSGPPPKKLIVKDLIRGSGAAVKPHTQITTHYVAVNYRTGKPSEVRWRGSPFKIGFGPGQEVQGWEKGLVGMRVGGRRELIVPSRLAYGTGALVYVIDLLAVK